VLPYSGYGFLFIFCLVLFGETSLERDIVLFFKNLYWRSFAGFSPPRGLPMINLVYTVDVFLLVILMHAVIKSLKLKNTKHT
jgi:hypothetical protein